MSKFNHALRIACFATLTAAPFGCAGKKDEMARAKILDQAAFDLQCTRAQLTVEKLSDDHQFMGVKNTTWGVQGCENRGTYKSSCGLGNCQVISDSKSQAR
jgi:hypothetical protein